MGNGVLSKERRRKQQTREEGDAFGGKIDNYNPNRPKGIELVLAEVSHPEWEKADVFVFSMPPVWTDIGEEDQKKGRFYSRIYRFVGTWRVEQNLLYILWDAENKMDVLRAEVEEFVFENPQTGLRLRVVEPTILPNWFAPEVLSKRFEKSVDTTLSYECAICCFELNKGQCCALRRYTRRVCEHYLHYECANYILMYSASPKQEGECPECGAQFTEVKEVPDLCKDPRGWFQVVDADFGGSLNKSEVTLALAAVLPVEREKLEVVIDNNWYIWDPDESGTITQTEFMEPGIGLKDYILKNLAELKRTKKRVGASEADLIPNLDTHPMEWFEYWDVDNSGTLELSELIRAFVRTFCVTSWGEPIFKRAYNMRMLAKQVWLDCGFHMMDGVDFETFIEPNGLADTFLHNSIHCQYFGEGSAGFV